MEEALTRLALFTVMPLLLGMALVLFDRTATGPVRRAEAFLVPLFMVGVGGGGMTAFIAHVFIAETGTPFRIEVGMASLAVGLLGAIATEWRDGFREATVMAATVLGLGTAAVQLMEIAATGLTPGNTAETVSGFAVPALLVWFLIVLRRAERTESPTIVLRSWTIPVRRGSVVAVAIAAVALPVGNATGQVVVLSLVAMAVAAAAFWWIVSRAASHRVGAAGA